MTAARSAIVPPAPSDMRLEAAWGALRRVNAFGGPRRTEYGQFEGNSNVYAVVRYAF